MALYSQWLLLVGTAWGIFDGTNRCSCCNLWYQEEQVTESNILIYTTPERQVPNIQCRCLCFNYDINKLVTRHYSCICVHVAYFLKFKKDNHFFWCLLEGQRTPGSNTRFFITYPNRQVLRQVVDQHILQKDEARRDCFFKNKTEACCVQCVFICAWSRRIYESFEIYRVQSQWHVFFRSGNKIRVFHGICSWSLIEAFDMIP